MRLDTGGAALVVAISLSLIPARHPVAQGSSLGASASLASLAANDDRPRVIVGADFQVRPALRAALRQKLEKRLQAIAAQLDGVMGYALVDLTSGERIGFLEHDIFPTASTIKLAILYELFKQAEGGGLPLDEVKPLDRRRAVGGSGVLVELGTPSLSLRDHATLMVVLSDNTATNVLIETLGMETINERMRGLGLQETKLRRYMLDLEAARRGNENVSTPAELIRLLEGLSRGEGLRPQSRDALLAILKKPKSSPMRRAIPPGVPVANKPGDLEGVRVDAGIVYAPNRPFVFAAMTTYAGNGEASEQAIEQAARAAYEYFERLGRGSEYGRQIKQ